MTAKLWPALLNGLGGVVRTLLRSVEAALATAANLVPGTRRLITLVVCEGSRYKEVGGADVGAEVFALRQIEACLASTITASCWPNSRITLYVSKVLAPCEMSMHVKG